MTDSTSPGYLLLEDGTRFDGVLCGADGEGLGEVVFTTGMSGYQESVTDPSFARQIIVFTYPHIGNYGVSAEAMESAGVHARAVVMRSAVNREDAPTAERGWLDWLRDCGVPAISEVDTRALVRHIRTAGAMRGGLFAASVPVATALESVLGEPPMTGLDLAREVTPDTRHVPRRGQRRPADRCDRHRHQAVDRAQPRRARRAPGAASLHRRPSKICWHPTPTPSSSPTDPVTRPPWTTSSTPCAPSSARGRRSASASGTS